MDVCHFQNCLAYFRQHDLAWLTFPWPYGNSSPCQSSAPNSFRKPRNRAATRAGTLYATPFCGSYRQLTGILKGMAGPAASVLSPKRLTASDLQILLASFPGELMKHNSTGDEWVFRTLPDGNAQRQLEDTSSFDVQLDDLERAGEFGRGFRSEGGL